MEYHHEELKFQGIQPAEGYTSYGSKDEETARYKLFVQTQARVELLNKLNGEAVFGITWMADRYDEEKYKRPSIALGVAWLSAGGLVKPKGFVPTAPVRNFTGPLAGRKSPAAVDWRLTEAVTPIKNQGTLAGPGG
eukprot:Skav231619  [mRNA]  locus=scaffold1638:229721:232180:+ [translate_table: standard]